MTLSESWKKTINDGFKDPARWMWPGFVIVEVSDYNDRLASTSGYVPVDWKLIFAMLWVESGGPKCAAWTGRVMQIGNPGDPGYKALKTREGATALVVRDELLRSIDGADQKMLNTPLFNLRAGIAYLFSKMALSEIASLPDAVDTSLHKHQVKAGDSGAKIAAIEGTTIEDLQASNPGVDVSRLHLDQTLQFHKAHKGRRIVGWRVFDPPTIAKQYNTGDSSYAEKLRFVLAGLQRE